MDDPFLEEIIKLQTVVDQQTLILNEILRNTRSQMISTLAPVVPEDALKLPLKHFDEFIKFETKLKGDDPFKKYMVS